MANSPSFRENRSPVYAISDAVRFVGTGLFNGDAQRTALPHVAGNVTVIRNWNTKPGFA
jgi:hypothetical protein